ncbi:MAG: hypothetical protein JW954_05100 [Dehalococcoidaceae bacterium]|nr:hypothetical protein [Dehalococcoidaceae bacterium]
MNKSPGLPVPNFKRFIPLLVFLFTFTLIMLLPYIPVSGEDSDFELQEAMQGNVPGFSAQVSGSGHGWYGDSLRVYFNNSTTQKLRVKIPVGLRLVPANSNVQTMYTAGGEVFEVPEGESSYVFKAFCGEKHDSAPGVSDNFSPGGFAEGELMQTLKNISREQVFNSNAQDAVWNRTDGLDISENEEAQKFTGGNKIDAEKTAAAGAAGALAGGATSALMNRGNGGNGGQTSGENDKTPPSDEEDYLIEDNPPEEDADAVPPEESEENPEAPDESGAEPVRYKQAADPETGRLLLDPQTGEPLPVNAEGKVLYGGEWISPDEAAAKLAMDRQWLEGRQQALENIDKFKKSLQEYNNLDPDARARVEEYQKLQRQFYESSDPAERARLAQELSRQRSDIEADDGARHAFELSRSLQEQAIRGNENYDVKSIMKREGLTETTQAFDRAVHDGYLEVDQRFVDKLNEMGFRRGGREFTIKDLQEYRNKSSKGKPSMDRDYGLNEDKLRDLLDKLSKAEPGSAEAKDIASKIAAEHANTKITVDPDKYASYLRREIVSTNTQLEKMRADLANLPPNSAEAKILNAEIERMSTRPEQLKSELNQIDAKSARVKDAYIQNLENRLSKAEPGSSEAQRLTAELGNAKTRFAGKAEIDLSPSGWHDSANGLYKRTFSDVTGTDPDKAFQCLTHSKHREAYQDMAVLRGDPANPAMAEQTSSVSRVKEIENNALVEEGKLNRGQGVQETARGYAKDIKTKVQPQMAADPNVSPEKADMVKRIGEVFEKAGKGEIRPGEVDGALRRAVPEIKDLNMEKATRIIDANYESSIKYQGTGTGGEPPRIVSSEAGPRPGGIEGGGMEKVPDAQKVHDSGLAGKAFSRVSDLAVTENYYRQNLAQGMSHGEALSVATAQTAAGNVAQMSGAADPRISMAAGSLLPNGMNNMLPDQAIENWTGTTYQAGKAGLESLKESFSSGQLNTEAVDKFAESVASRPGNDPFKGIGQLSKLVGEEVSRSDGGNIISDLKNIYDTGAGSEVLNQSMQEFQQNIAAGKPGDRMVALQGWDHLTTSVSEVIVDPVHEAKSLVNDAINMVKYGVGDGFWTESWEHTKGVLQDTPLVGQVINGYNEIATGIGESGVGGFAQEMYEGGTALAGEAAEYVADSAKSAYNYIKSWF